MSLASKIGALIGNGLRHIPQRLGNSLVLALVGAAAGVSLSYAAFSGATISTLGGALFDSQLVYSLTVSPRLLASAVVLACALGVAGGLPPAIRAGRANIAVALHEE